MSPTWLNPLISVGVKTSWEILPQRYWHKPELVHAYNSTNIIKNTRPMCLLGVTSSVNEQDLFVGKGYYRSQTSKAFKEPLARKSRCMPWPRTAISLCKLNLVKGCTNAGDISRCCGLLSGLGIFPYPGRNKNIATSRPSPQSTHRLFQGQINWQ